jgi:putative tryptophan/tyrosine transport system substrate-binding protein
MTSRRTFIAGLGAAAGSSVIWPLAARGQQRRVIGYLTPRTQNEDVSLKDFLDGLKQAGFTEADNVTIEYRFANGDNTRLPALAADLVRRRVAVIAAFSLPGALATKAATDSIPIVFWTGVDPVASGLVASLVRPSGNLTGATSLADEIAPKRLEMMHQLLPNATDFALLVDPSNPNNEPQSNDMRAAARTLGLNAHILPAKDEGDFASVFEKAVALRATGLIIGPNAFSSGVAANQQLALLAARHALPTISFTDVFPAAGGLMSYGASAQDESPARIAGIYTGRILNGEKPANLPVQQATKTDLVINLKTAKLFGLTFPLTLLGRADKVIE